MNRKNCKFFFGIILFFLTAAVNAQVGGAGSVYDSSVITKKRMKQQNQFWEGTYNFPAKPRNMWEVGASLGTFTISGDVPVRFFTFPNFAVHVRKAFGYVFSMRLQYLNAQGQGLSYNASENFLKNDAWNVNLPVGKRYFAPDALINSSTSGVTVYTDNAGNRSTTNDIIYYNYKTKLQDLSLQGIITLNNVRFHKQKNGFVVYGGGGIGLSVYNTFVNALDANGNNYSQLFRNIYNKYNTSSGNYSNRNDIRKDLKAGMDNTYETPAENYNGRHAEFSENTLKPTFTILAGVAFKLGKRVNLAIEDRFTRVKSDLMDGQRWNENAWGDASLTRDWDSYNYLSIGVNFNLGGKSVEPLWWINPLNYAYDELRNHRNVVIPVNNCLDGDGDGVCDHLDREPNTPAGCPVDTHGVTRDTDGDGVPDCKDKQLITPTECQPVNADGVGKCPDPECCKVPPVVVPQVVCPCDYPTLTFKGNVTALNNDNKAMLNNVAAKLKANPTCTITLNGYPETSKASQANCQKRMDGIKIYLIEKAGISADRIMTSCEGIGAGDKNAIDIKCN